MKISPFTTTTGIAGIPYINNYLADEIITSIESKYSKILRKETGKHICKTYNRLRGVKRTYGEMEEFHLNTEEAKLAVNNSTVYKMLENDSTARWQMHQPLMETVEEIFDEFKSFV